MRLDMRSVRDIMQRGGTILYSSRCPEFKDPVNQQKAITFVGGSIGMDALVVIGGDGTFRVPLS